MNQGSESLLLDLVATHPPLAASVFSYLDSPSRLAVCRSSTVLRQWALTDQLTVTLLSYGGLSDAEWQRRLARAEQVLAVRGPQRRNKLVLRLPTPNPAALQSILSVSAAAGRAVTDLEVQQGRSSAEPHEGVHTPWLQALPAAFPNLRILRINRLCGCLPPPAQMPSLRELHVVLCPRTPAGNRGMLDSESDSSSEWETVSNSSVEEFDAAAEQEQGSAGQAVPSAGQQAQAGSTSPTVPAPPYPQPATTEEQCASIAPYLSQLTALSLSRQLTAAGNHVPWPLVFTHTTHTLTHFTTTRSMCESLLGLLCTHAPALTHLNCDWVTTQLSGQHVGKTWAVKEVVVGSAAAELVKLPRCEGRLMLLPSTRKGLLDLIVELNGRQGLSERDTHCFQHHWHFATPPHITLCLNNTPTTPTEGLQTGIETALNQLSCLPAGSVIKLSGTNNWYLGVFTPAIRAIAAVGAVIQHVTVLPPELVGTHEAMSTLCIESIPIQHVCLGTLTLREQHRLRCGPWQSIRVQECSLPHLLCLPDPTDTPYEIHCHYLNIDTDQCTSTLLTKLEQRLQHWTFVLSEACIIQLPAPTNTTHPSNHPTALRTALQALRGFKWRKGRGQGLWLVLRGWSLTHDLITELTNLPVFEFPVTLTLSACDWSDDVGVVQRLPIAVPVCYARWNIAHSGSVGVAQSGVKEVTCRHLVAVCKGTGERGGEREGAAQGGDAQISAQARGDAPRDVGMAHEGAEQGCRPLQLSVSYNSRHIEFSDAQRSLVEACIDEGGWSSRVGVQWGPSDW